MSIFVTRGIAVLSVVSLISGCQLLCKSDNDPVVAQLVAELEDAQSAEVRALKAQELRQTLRIASPEARFQYPVLHLESVAVGLDSGPGDWDGDGRDDGMVVTLIPRDQFGDTLKVPGAVEVELYSTGLGGFPSKIIAEWPAISPEELNERWIDLTFSGYRMKLPWLGPVVSTRSVVLVVRFITRSGRVFRVEKTQAQGIRR